MSAFARVHDATLREFVERLLEFDTTGGNEAPAQAWLADQLAGLGFSTYEWTADADRLAAHPSFPDGPAEIPTADRPSVAGVLELGDPDAGPTLVLNGHVDVVPTERALWSSDPFEPTWDGDALTARGAADMKAGLGACVFAARHLADTVEDAGAAGDVGVAGDTGAAGATGTADTEDADATGLDGRIVVESVVGEEVGGIGAAAAALDNPYPFERDAAIVAEPTDLRPVVATEGCLMMRLGLDGRSAHAATRWRGESVLPRFERVREAFERLESERARRVTHPLYEEFPIPWPVVAGTLRAGSWPSTVPASLVAEYRIGVAPGESVRAVEAAFRERLAEICADDEWLREHPPTFERFAIQFEPSEIDPDEPVVRAVQRAMEENGRSGTAPRGATYGTDARHYVGADVPTVVFGPGSIEQAHFPEETIRWPEVTDAGAILADAAREFLGGRSVVEGRSAD
jgi:acetylornithine deacetylase